MYEILASAAVGGCLVKSGRHARFGAASNLFCVLWLPRPFVLLAENRPSTTQLLHLSKPFLPVWLDGGGRISA
jgi:hypothetical protein